MGALLSSFLLVFTGLMPIVNPPGSALLFLTLTRRGTHADRAALAKRIAIYSLLIMSVSLSIGAFVIQFFGVSVPVLRVAGGLVMALAGWRALNAPPPPEDAQAPDAARPGELSSMAFYPLTMPITAGPGTVAVSIALGTTGSESEKLPFWSAIAGMVGALTATVVIAALIYGCYRYADRLEDALGKRGSDALGRLFSFILICIGIQVFWIGFAELWSSLPPR